MTIDLWVGTGSLPLITLRQRPMCGASATTATAPPPPLLSPLGLSLRLFITLKQWTPALVL